MKKSVFRKAHVLMLIAALIFGQVGAGFLHNKHDAHEAVIDSDQPVLLNHGEHCKVCAVDWVHQIDLAPFDIAAVHLERFFPPIADITSINDVNPILKSSRAPPLS